VPSGPAIASASTAIAASSSGSARHDVKRWSVTASEAGPLGDLVKDDAAVAEGRVFVGRKRVQDATFLLTEGDEVTLAAPAEGHEGEVVVLARQGELLALWKPAGIPTIPDHGGSSHTLLAHAARIADMPIDAVHPTSRLDRDVSGVVIFALSPEAAARLAKAREDGTYARRYVAIAARAPATERGVWDARIGRAKDPRKRQVNGREPTDARTRFTVVATAPGGQALLAVVPETGRTHQIRVHAGHANAPLLGDRVYGGPPRLTLAGGKVLALERIALHCLHVAACGLTATAPVAPEMTSMWAALGGDPSAWERAAEIAV
jgi:23S rRNA pseudouridine1911/1915/1917 synthase